MYCILKEELLLNQILEVKGLTEGLNGVYYQPSNSLKINRHPSKSFKVFQISLFQLIFTAFRLLKNF